jgi:hypothetical protein
MAFLKFTTDRTVKRLRWVMVGALLFDYFITILGQPNTYWQHPEAAVEINQGIYHSLSRGWPFYCFESLIIIVLMFLIVSILPRRTALFAIFTIILNHFFGASTWLCYHWHFGVGGLLVYGVILSAILVLWVPPMPSKATGGLFPQEPEAIMGEFKTILLVICVTLVLVDDSWRIWAWHDYTGSRAFARQFRLDVLHTNDTSGIGIFYSNTEQPIWTKFDFSNGVMESYYFRGKDTFDVTLSSNRPPRYGVFFRGPGKSVTWWLDDAGSGFFTDRIYYNTNGDFSKREVWYKEAWRLVDRRDGKNGLIIDGRWHQLARGTNETWTIEAVSTNRF